jgi:hypothetical protein
VLKKGDIIVIAAILSVALLGLVFLVWSRDSAAQGLCAEIYLDGELVRTVALSAREQEIVLERENPAGYNVLQAGPQGIRMLEASCNNQDCVHAGMKSRSGDIIACLPHRLLIRLTGQKEGDFDAIAR